MRFAWPPDPAKQIIVPGSAPRTQPSALTTDDPRFLLKKPGGYSIAGEPWLG
jgi:hypothetical protein